MDDREERLEKLRDTKELIAELNNQHGNEVYSLIHDLSDLEQAWVRSEEDDIDTFLKSYEQPSTRKIDMDLYTEVSPGYYELDPHKCYEVARKHNNTRLMDFWQKKIDERDKWKLNMPTKEGVQGTYGPPLYTVNLRPFIEQVATEQVMKVLNSVEYQVRALDVIYPKLFSEHPPIHPTEQQKSEHPHDNPVQEMNTILNTLYSALAGEQRSYSVDRSTEQNKED